MAFHELDTRIKIFTSLRLDALDEISLRRRLNEIGAMRREASLETTSRQG